MFGEDDDQLDSSEQDTERPSIGQLIAGIKQPSYMPRAAAPNTADAPAPDVRPKFDPSLIPNVGQNRQPAPSEVPVPPSGSSNPNLADLAKRQADLGTPLSRQDPKYRPTTKGRIGGFFQGMAAGASGHPEKAPYVGPGAVNMRFGRDEATREANLANVNTQIGTQEKLDTENEKLYRDAIRQAYEGQLGSARQETAGAQKETADVRASLAQSQKELNEAKANKADQDKTPTSEFAGWYEAFTRDNGRRPNAKEITAHDEQMRRAGKDTSASDLNKTLTVENQRQRELDTIDKERDAERARRHEEFSKTPAGKLDFDGKKAAAFDTQLQQELEKKYSDKAKSVNDRYDQMLGLTKAGQKLEKQRNAAPAKSAPKAPPKVGETILVDGKPHRVTGFNPKTKKPIAVPIAGQ